MGDDDLVDAVGFLRRMDRVKHPMYYYCPGCQNPRSPFGALDRLRVVEEKSCGMIVVDCLDCGARSESYHRDLRGKMPRKYTKRNAIMIAADFALDYEIREYNDSRERSATHAEVTSITSDEQSPSVRKSASDGAPKKKPRETQAEMFD